MKVMRNMTNHVTVRRVLRSAAVVATVIGPFLATAFAQPAQPSATPAEVDSAWSKGVSTQERQTARGLLEEGNALYLQNLHAGALAKYVEALKHWNHPAICFNVARTLVALDRADEAVTYIKRALEYGAAPLGEEFFAEAQNYQRLLNGMVSEVEIRCKQPDMTVTFDTQKITCPSSTLVTKPGKHSIAANKPGFVAWSSVEILSPGKAPVIEPVLTSIVDATVTKTRWATWKPWTVVGSGVAVFAAGAALQLSARSTRQKYIDALNQECSLSSCAEVSTGTRELNDSWRFRDRLSVPTMAVGVALVVAGGVLLYANRSYTVVDESRSNRVSWTIDPLSHSVVASGKF
jgi:hypothetical protein